MKVRLVGSLSLVCVAVAVFLPPLPKEASATEELQTTLEQSTEVASSSMVPVLVPGNVRTPSMLDIAADMAIKKKADALKSDSLSDTGARETKDALKSDGVSGKDAQKQQKITVSDTLRDPLPDAFTTKLSVATTSIPGALLENRSLKRFQTVLKPGGFVRPQWQSVAATTQFTKAHKDEPFVVMIDPGHGGRDPGAKGHNGLLEKDLTLDIAKRVRLFLTEFDDIDVTLTRNHDHGLSRMTRIAAIKRANADMVISLHFNHLPQSDVNLVESFYAGPENLLQSSTTQTLTKDARNYKAQRVRSRDVSFTQGSKRLAHILQRQLYAEVGFQNNAVRDAGVKRKTLFVLTQGDAPSALVEISCLSHPAEADKLATEDYRNRLAAALVDGIRNYRESSQSQPTQELVQLDV